MTFVNNYDSVSALKAQDAVKLDSMNAFSKWGSQFSDPSMTDDDLNDETKIDSSPLKSPSKQEKVIRSPVESNQLVKSPPQQLSPRQNRRGNREIDDSDLSQDSDPNELDEEAEKLKIMFEEQQLLVLDSEDEEEDFSRVVVKMLKNQALIFEQQAQAKVGKIVNQSDQQEDAGNKRYGKLRSKVKRLALKIEKENMAIQLDENGGNLTEGKFDVDSN